MPEMDLNALGAAAGPLQVWVLPALLGLGLASATGLRTFLPLLMLALAKRHKWLVVEAVPPRDGRDGRLEAVARSLPFGLRDDLVIRVRPIATGTRVDIRSAARSGDADFGSNARRISQLFAELADQQGRPLRR